MNEDINIVVVDRDARGYLIDEKWLKEIKRGRCNEL